MGFGGSVYFNNVDFDAVGFVCADDAYYTVHLHVYAMALTLARVAILDEDVPVVFAHAETNRPASISTIFRCSRGSHIPVLCGRTECGVAEGTRVTVRRAMPVNGRCTTALSCIHVYYVYM